MEPLKATSLAEHPLLALIHEFLKQNHMIPDTLLEKIRVFNEDPSKFEMTVDESVCTKCQGRLDNWVQLGRYRCPPKDRRNPLEIYQQPPQSPRRI